MKLRIRDVAILMICILIGVGIFGLKLSEAQNSAIKQLMITEVMLENTGTLRDDFGAFTDYIEVYNGTNGPLTLSDYYLTDTNKLIQKWQLPNQVLKPGEFILFFASGKGLAHETNFKLDRRGEGLILSNKQGETLQALVVPKASANISYGIDFETQEFHYYVGGTPMAVNQGYAFDHINQFEKDSRITWSETGGFFNEPIQLQLGATLENGVLRYTLDGSDPTVNSPVYEKSIAISNRSPEKNQYASQRKVSPFAKTSGANQIPTGPVDKGTVVRCRLFVDDLPVSETQTQTYFVFDQGSEHYSLPVVALTTDPEHLFNDTTGIYCGGDVLNQYIKKNPTQYVDGGVPANYNQEGPEWERPATFEYFVAGKKVFEQNIGLSTFGGWSRANVKKSLKIKASTQYDSEKDTMEYPLINNALDANGEVITSYKNIALRGGANDYEYTIFRDEMIQSLGKEAGVATQGYEPVILFIDSEYWGIYWIREVEDRHYIEAHYPVKADDVTIITNEGELYEGDETGLQAYHDMMNFFLNADLSDPAQYAACEALVDIDNFINYYLIQIYCANTDWPGNNLKIWKGATNATDGSAKWRYLLFDTDFGFALYPQLQSTYDTNNLAIATDPNGAEWPNPPWSTLILRRLMDNETFKAQFIARGQELLETTLSKEAVVARIASFETLLTQEMPANIARYNLYSLQKMSDWKANVQVLYDFAENRPMYMKRFLK